MKIEVRKFGKTLTSRDSGQEAYKAIHKKLEELKKGEDLILDFSGINTFTPSWGDEFISPLVGLYGQKLVLINTKNSSVMATLELLAEIYRIKFTFREE
ncbi:MAG: STAS-like domain-containing protein [Patescibacteria group bacterium]